MADLVFLQALTAKNDYEDFCVGFDSLIKVREWGLHSEARLVALSRS